MNDTETRPDKKNSLTRRAGASIFARLPLTLVLTIYLLAVYLLKVDLAAPGLGSILGYIYFGLGLVILFFQFFKSADISTGNFFLHLTGAVLSLIVATALMTLLLSRSGSAAQPPITFHYWYGCAIILADAILSPFNSFRTAKRNFAVGDG